MGGMCIIVNIKIMVIHEISFVLVKYDSKLKTFCYKISDILIFRLTLKDKRWRIVCENSGAWKPILCQECQVFIMKFHLCWWNMIQSLRLFATKFQISSFSDSLSKMKDEELCVKILGHGNQFCAKNVKFLIGDKCAF